MPSLPPSKKSSPPIGTLRAREREHRVPRADPRTAERVQRHHPLELSPVAGLLGGCPYPRPETSVNYPAGVVFDTGHGPGCDGPHPARRGGRGGDAPGVGDVTFIDGTGQFTFSGLEPRTYEVTFSLREPSPAGSSLGVLNRTC